MSVKKSKKGIEQCKSAAANMLMQYGVDDEKDALFIIEQIMWASVLQGQVMLSEAAKNQTI